MPARWQRQLVRKSSVSAIRCEITPCIDAVLAADEFQAAEIQRLTTRETFPRAASLLQDQCGSEHLARALHVIAREPGRLFPVALACGLQSAFAGKSAQGLAPEHLRQLALGSEHTKGARLALAAIGLPLSDWAGLPCHERAAVALRHLVFAFHSRSAL